MARPTPPPALVKLSPARGFGLALCRGMSLSSRYLVPKCQRELQVRAQHLSACAGHPGSLQTGCWVQAGSLGGSGDKVHGRCNPLLVRLPSLVSLSS